MNVLPGTTYADLVTIEEMSPVGTNRRVRCLCKCGQETVKYLNNLRAGRSTSCGCTYEWGAVGRAASVAARRARSQESEVGRICHTCETWKPWAEFCNDPRRPYGKSSNCLECAKWRGIRAIYGLSRAEWERLREDQGGRCGLCGDADSPLAVDHDHSCCTGSRGRSDGRAGCKKCIRGLLCDFCNRVLGRIEQKPELAGRFADYLRRRPFA